MKKAIRCFISGRVQGVFFRVATREQADLCGITGWVRNLPDGRVEVLACGDDNQLRQFREWLQKGPELARVSMVECQPEEDAHYTNFSIR